MSDTFGLKIGLEGEKEFKNALREINENFKVLQSEMNLVSSAFEKNDESIQAVTARNSVLNKEIDTQKDKISALEKALSNATASFGENDKRTQAWTIQLNNAKAGLNNMERELAQNNKTLAESNNGKAAAEKADKDFAAAVKEIEANFRSLGSEMNLVSSRFDKHDKSAEALTVKNTVLNREIELQKEKVENLGKAMANSASAFGESDKRTQAWTEKLNNAKAELNNMERELSNNEKSIKDVSRGYDDAGRKLDEYGNEIEDATEKTSIFGNVLKANLASAAIQAGLGALVDMIKNVGSAVKDYISDGSQMAKEAAESHAKLEQVMRNTMDASDEQIQSIVELTKAQEQLGVVSHTVQLNGAQELGTYLEKSDSLKALIPVMNDMIVQQYGVNASQESAANIATMLGKVMNGQVGALSRYGYTFDEVQENILKYGTEAERAAVLAEVVGESVGGMNEALAATDLGKMSSLNTILDNTKIKVGEVANDIEAQILGRMLPSIDSLSGAFLGVITGEGSVEDMAAAFTDVFAEIESIIQEFLPVILELGGNILTAVVTGIVDNLDIITDAILNLLEMLVGTISELLPLLVEAGISLIFALLDGILQALPTLIEAALEAVITLATGIADALPELIPVIIETIIFIVETLLNNLDKLLDAALAIIMGLADGIIAALPVLIEALPQIIISIINFIVESLPKIIEMGIELVIKLAFGLIQAIPQLLMAIPQIIGALMQGIIDLFPKIIESGKNIVKSLWEGIKGMGHWLADNFMDMVAGVVNSIIGAVNNVLGLIGIQLPTMQLKAKVETAPVSVGVNHDAIRRAESVVAEAAKENVKIMDEANAAILKSAYDSAEERIAAEKGVIKGKSTEAKEQAKIAKELAKEEERAAKELAREKERIAKKNADAINRLGADLTKALKEQYGEQKSAYLQAINDEVDAVRSASYEKMLIYDAEFAEKMKLIDDVESYRLSAIQAEIDAIDAKTRAEDESKRQRDYEEKLAELKKKFSSATTNKEREDIQKEVNRLVESRQREITLEQRNAQKALLRQQLEEEKQVMKEARDALQQSKLDELDIQKEAIKKYFDELMSSENLKTDALKLMLSGQQDEILTLLDSYNPGWRDAGKSFAEMLGAGISDGRAGIDRSLTETLNLINGANITFSQSAGSNPQAAAASITFAGLEQNKIDTELKTVLNAISETLTDVLDSIRSLTADIRVLWQNVKTQIEDYASFTLGMAKLTSAIENVKIAAAGDVQGGLGALTNNFYFDNITVRSHSDMQAIADFTFRKIQQALNNRGVRI